MRRRHSGGKRRRGYLPRMSRFWWFVLITRTGGTGGGGSRGEASRTAELGVVGRVSLNSRNDPLAGAGSTWIVGTAGTGAGASSVDTVGRRLLRLRLRALRAVCAAAATDGDGSPSLIDVRRNLPLLVRTLLRRADFTRFVRSATCSCAGEGAIGPGNRVAYVAWVDTAVAVTPTTSAICTLSSVRESATTTLPSLDTALASSSNTSSPSYPKSRPKLSRSSISCASSSATPHASSSSACSSPTRPRASFSSATRRP